MIRQRFKKESWYSNAAAICIGVILFFILWRFPEIIGGLKVFLGFFKTIILGCAIAYIVNPLAVFMERVLHKINNDKLRRGLSNTLAFAIVIGILVLALITLVPELIRSFENLLKNFDGYVVSLTAMLEDWGLSKTTFDLSSVVSSSEDLLHSISSYIGEHSDTILARTTDAGKGVMHLLIAIIVAIYLTSEKLKLKAGLKRLLKALFDKDRYKTVSTFLNKCNTIFTRYIIFSLVDALIIGIVNWGFMTISGMEYIWLVSFTVAVTNLIPTFGPFVGAGIGAFIILMTNPHDALVFLIFTLILQLLDGYVIKPKLFGDTFGVSGLWIVVGVIVGGSMFGVLGILLAIPTVAVIDFIYHEYFITGLERKRVEPHPEEE
ncbi:MAG: AI-2E family transporter [Clostridiales bacterium]|nr:AI-2E family transporter [Clostridiales bacterium]